MPFRPVPELKAMLEPTMNALQDTMEGDIVRWILGFSLAAIVAFAGFRSRSLSLPGALAAIAAGGLIVGAGGWWTGLLLVAFFVSSATLSHARPKANATAGEVRQARGHRREAVQVLANGGVPVICALVGSARTDPAPWFVAAAAAIAGATADTWATEIGRGSTSAPRSIITGKALPPGTSGAISAIGTLGSAAGAVVIAGLAALGAATNVWIAAPALGVFFTVAVAGVAGSLLDSVLGATVQGIWWCSACDQETELASHHCGSRVDLVRGFAFMDNDRVNAISIAGAGGAGLSMTSLIF